MTSKNYRIRIAKDGFEFEVEGDKHFVLSMAKRFSGKELAIPNTKDDRSKAPAAETQEAKKAGKPVSPGEFCRQYGLKRHIDLVHGFAYFLERHSGIESFSSADINNCYYEAKIEASNTSEYISMHVRQGNIMPAKKKESAGKRKYTLTSSGTDRFESKFVRKAGK